MDLNLLATLALLIGLELVLGIDNILLISILTGRLPQEKQRFARQLGLGLALLARVVFILGASWLTRLTTPVWGEFTYKHLILLIGGLFLLFKAAKEIHHTVEHHDDHGASKTYAVFGQVIFQIILLDIVFSIDSVITAVGLTDVLWVIITAVLASFLVVLFFAQPVSQFVQNNPALKVLALAFLMCIGVTLFIEGMNYHVPKAYIYLPMGFALLVELLQMRMDKNTRHKSRTK